MLEFLPTQLRSIEFDFRDLAELNAELSAQLASNDAVYEPATEVHPFIQLDYGEIDRDALDRILGYANIVKANCPLGLPYDFPPLTCPGTGGHEWQLYPLSGLDAHLQSIDPITVRLLDGYDSLADLFESIENDGKDVSADQYLVLALTEMIRYCKKRNIGIVTHW